VVQFEVSIHRFAMNVCLKARDSQAKSLDADTASVSVFSKLTHYRLVSVAENHSIYGILDPVLSIPNGHFPAKGSGSLFRAGALVFCRFDKSTQKNWTRQNASRLSSGTPPQVALTTLEGHA
jgi:hypothetical protein